MPSTHIIIVNYNAGAWLARSLRSALEYSDGLVTVIDNQSVDESVALAKQSIAERHDSARVEWQLNNQNLGFAAANNQVLRNLKADYAVLLNPDCELQVDTLSDVIDVMQASQTIGLASCRILNEDGSLQATCRRRFPTPSSALGRLLQLNRLFPDQQKFSSFDLGGDSKPSDPVEMVEAVSGAFMVASKLAIEKVGVLDEEYFMHCEDLDWCKRFQQAGLKVAFVPKTFVVHAKGVSSSSRPIRVLYTLHKGMNRFFDKFYTTHYSWPMRYFVKAGISASFLARAFLALLRGLFQRAGS